MENNQVDINLSTDIKTDNLVPLNITLMSRDINNNSFLLKFKSNGSDVQLNNSFTVEILSVFPNSKIEILTQATVYGNTAMWEFDTKYITRNELVSNYVYVKKDGAPIISADANAFTFNVGLSKIDGNAGKTAETYDRNYEKVLHEFEVAINLTKDEWARMAVDARNLVDETRNFVDEIKGVTVDQFVETKMGEELANLEVNYATRLTGLESNDASLTAQLAQKVDKGTISIGDAVGEWWIHPMATSQHTPYPRTVSGAVSSTGEILAIEYNHAVNKEKRYAVAQATIDDHNVPSVWVKQGSRTVVAWTNHNRDNYLRFKVGSRSGDLGSLVFATEVSVDIGVPTSYTQIHKINHLSNNLNDTFYMIFRANDAQWKVLIFSVNQITGELVVENGIGTTLVASTGSRQCYITSADAHNQNGNQLIRIAWGYNPAQSVHSIYYIELNTVTGALTSPFDNQLNANLSGIGLPIPDAGLVPMVPNLPAGESRRLFYVRPGPDSPAVSYADWSESNPDDSTYKVMEVSGAEVIEEGTFADHDGLIPNGTGYAQTPAHESMHTPDGFQYIVFVKMPDTPQAVELGRRYSSSTTASFHFRIADTGRSEVLIRTTNPSGSGHNSLNATSIYNDYWGLEVGFKLVVDTTAGTLMRYVSTDGGGSWVKIGVTLGESFTPYPMIESPDPLIVGSPSSALNKAVVFKKAELLTLSGELVAGVDFENDWIPYTTSHVDSAGKEWSLFGEAVIGSTTLKSPSKEQLTTSVYEFGISGTRVGYTPEANYIAGMAFENPSYDGTVITAHTDGLKETVNKWHRSDAGYIAEVLHKSNTEDGRIIRPYVPIDNGAIPALLTKMTSYSGYNSYYGDLITT